MKIALSQIAMLSNQKRFHIFVHFWFQSSGATRSLIVKNHQKCKLPSVAVTLFLLSLSQELSQRPALV